MRRIRLVIEYDGTDFVGWQRQANGPSVQSAIEAAITQMTGESLALRGAGRTDSGVHAEGQVAAFTTSSSVAPLGFLRGLNALLPRTIAVVAADEVPLDFDPRRDARGKLYRYRIWNGEARRPIQHRTEWHLLPLLDCDCMRAAAPLLVGRHDFAAFQAADCDRKNSVRTIYGVEVVGQAGAIDLSVYGDAFLKHMVRILVGTLVDIGRGRAEPSLIPALLQQGDRRVAGPTAPPHGLTLVRVDYDLALPTRWPRPPVL